MQGDPPSPSQVGRYLVLKPLGAGGMGVVYAAYDPDLDRKVALKVLNRKQRVDEEVAQARLLREAQAMARISHPNVMPIFDVGLLGGQVFLAMELIDGGTLQDWVEAQPRSWRQVVEVFLAAGQGLAAAHDAALIHRDFKPSNVLVSRGGRVCVTDFGLARQAGDPAPEAGPTEETDVDAGPEKLMLGMNLTATGFVMGTPYFMAPEQFRGGADARSDQFSFCVSLYWALYRERPFQHTDLRPQVTASTASVTGDAAPPLPSLRLPDPPRDSKVPAWIRQVLVRGLAMDPRDRFPSMRELLEALSQERRLVRTRRRVAASLAAAAGVALVGAVAYQQSQACAGAAQLMDEVWNPPVQQSVESSLAATGGAYGPDVARRVSGVLAGYASAWTRQRTDACEATRRRGTQTEELLSRRVGCLERRRRDLGAVVALLAHADASLAEKAVDAAHALPSLQECADLGALSEEQRLPEDPARRAEIERLGGLLSEVKALADAGRIRPALEKALGMEQAVVATGHAPLIAEWRFLRGTAEDQLGRSDLASRELVQAAAEADAGRADRLKLSILTRLLYVEGARLLHYDRAEEWGALAEAALRRIGGDPDLEGDLRTNQGVMESKRDRLEVAQARFEQAQALKAHLPPSHPKRARLTFLLGNLLVKRGEHARAVKVLTTALEQTRAAVGPLHPDMARRHGLLALALRQLGELPLALEHARVAADIRKQVLGPDNELTAELMDEVGMCLLGLRRYGEALEVYRSALDIKRKALEPGDEQLQYSYDGVGQALLGLGRAREAIEPLRQAVAITSAPPGTLAESGFALARALWQEGRRPEALAEAARAEARFIEARDAGRAAEVASWRVGPGKH